ncbi:unnamed protein product [Enterobius vermicularis]|uniref:Sema domain-containing protein n=1 Tax=Enterobius vermicularis TaxID=51028 RepID=A0A158Q9G1_ENTVE|nr:unnamed protein product [Enterobius vermicularis]
MDILWPKKLYTFCKKKSINYCRIVSTLRGANVCSDNILISKKSAIVLLGLAPGEEIFTDGTDGNFTLEQIGILKVNEARENMQCIGLSFSDVKTTDCDNSLAKLLVCRADAGINENRRGRYGLFSLCSFVLYAFPIGFEEKRIVGGECPDAPKGGNDQFISRLVLVTNSTTKYCIHEANYHKTSALWFNDGEKFCQETFKGHLLSVNNREEDAFLRGILHPPFTSKKESRVLLGLLAYKSELLDFTDGSDGGYVFKQALIEDPTLLHQIHNIPALCFAMVRDYEAKKDTYTVHNCIGSQTKVVCKSKYPLKEPATEKCEVYMRIWRLQRLTKSPLQFFLRDTNVSRIATCVIPQLDNFYVYASLVSAKNGKSFYCLYDIDPVGFFNVTEAEFICQRDFSGHLLTVSDRYEMSFLSDRLFEPFGVGRGLKELDFLPLGAIRKDDIVVSTSDTDVQFIGNRELNEIGTLDDGGDCFTLARHYGSLRNTIYAADCGRNYKRFACKRTVEDDNSLVFADDPEKRGFMAMLWDGIQSSGPALLVMATFAVFIGAVCFALYQYWLMAPRRPRRKHLRKTVTTYDAVTEPSEYSPVAAAATSPTVKTAESPTETEFGGTTGSDFATDLFESSPGPSPPPVPDSSSTTFGEVGAPAPPPPPGDSSTVSNGAGPPPPPLPSAAASSPSPAPPVPLSPQEPPPPPLSPTELPKSAAAPPPAPPPPPL